MFLTGLGVGLTQELGLASSALGLADRGGDDPLDLGRFAACADLLAQTPLAELQPRLVKELDGGATLSMLVASAALANARAFGGEDYEGYHAFMALMPAYEMSQALSGRAAALPVLKVLYRNTARIQAKGADREPMLTSRPRRGATPADAEGLVQRVRREDKAGAEAALDAALRAGPESSFEHLIPVVCQEVDVHRVVLAWRGWDLLRLTGQEHASTLLRQSIRQCIEREADHRNDAVRSELPAVLEESGVLGKPLGQRAVDDVWIATLAHELANASRKQGAARVAAALAEGVTPDAVGQALSLAATQLMLRQRPRTNASPGKPVGSVHGAGTGVHGSDTAAAWRGMARFGSERQRKLALVAGGYHVAGQSGHVAPEHFAFEGVEVEGEDEQALLGMLRECLAVQDQAGAARAASCYAQEGHALAPLLALLHESSLASDGALHAEKYYRTQVEVIEGDRLAFRPLHAAALARVCASQSFLLAAGYEERRELFG